MLRFKTLLMICAMVVTAACSTTPRGGEPARVLTMGDSLLAWHGLSRRSVPDRLSLALNEPVVDRSFSGAVMLTETTVSGNPKLSISSQYKEGNWEWIILNGGGNDLWFGCGCSRCDKSMTRMISYDGTSGNVPDLVAELRATGARVVYIGYLRSPGMGSPIEHCRDDGDAFEARIARMADQMDGVWFLSQADLVPYGDRSFHALDMVHPSMKASDAIARRIATLIAEQQ